MNKIKGKINLVEMAMHQMMPKIKFIPSSLLKIKEQTQGQGQAQDSAQDQEQAQDQEKTQDGA